MNPYEILEGYKKVWEWLKYPIEKNYDAIPYILRVLVTLLLVSCGLTLIALFACLITGEIKL